MTLLELLVVVFILSALALSALSLTDTLDSQFRYEQTQTKLQQIRTGIVGESGAVYDGQRRLSGYVADLGDLPPSISALVAPANNTYDRVSPIYDADPDSKTGLNDGTNETILVGPSEGLFRGHRGPYVPLQATLSGARMFRDGWGNVSSVDDALNHGWVVPNPTAQFSITSLGADGIAGSSGQSKYDPDVSEQIRLDDWTVDISGWQVQVRKSSGSEDEIRVSLLVYYIDSGGQAKWRRFTTSRVTVDDTDPPETTVFDRSSENWPKGDSNWPTDDEGNITRIPIGEHLLVLVKDNNGIIHNGEPLFDGDAANGIQPVTKRVSFYPRTQRPSITLVIP